MFEEITQKMKVFVVYGTRPELIKVAPLILKLKSLTKVELKVVSTGQHKEMLYDLEKLFEISPDYSLDLMTKDQTVNSVVAKVITKMDELIHQESPELVFVQGDTATVLGASMACFYSKVDVAHIEAGLRSFNLEHPFPEEFNRRVVSIFAKYNFAPTSLSAQNLINEGVNKNQVFVTGNTVIDALNILSEKIETKSFQKKLILVTAHRRENHASGIKSICKAIQELLKVRSDVQFVWPVHPNPNVKEVVKELLGELDGVTLLEPIGYLELISTMKSAYIIWTDSGGIQEEAPSFKKPVLILREVTERPEVVDSGFGELTGSNTEKIITSTMRLLDDEAYYSRRISGDNPFGSGNACDQMLKILKLQD